jgi:acetoin utilization deacetylase AcuC-like enzyme
MRELAKKDLPTGDWQLVETRKASSKEVELVHDPEYIRHIELFCKNGGGMLDSGDTIASKESYQTALFAVGGCLTAVDLVISKRYRNAFALVRPPGHHASRCTAMGFCIFNNIAICARYLIKKYGLKRILILDLDDHHGNGTQDTFYSTGKVLYISLHEDPKGFPGTGFIDEIGQGDGSGYNVNIPLPFRTGDENYLKAIKEIVVPIASQYSPQFILISAGFDSHYSDPVGSLSLSSDCIGQLYKIAFDLASKNCNGRLLAALEGGYNTRILGQLAKQAISMLGGGSYRLHDVPPLTKERVIRDGENALREVKKTQRTFWRLD